VGLARAHTTSWKDIRDDIITPAVNAPRTDTTARRTALDHIDTLWRQQSGHHNNIGKEKDKQYLTAHRLLSRHFNPGGGAALTGADIKKLAKAMNSARPNLRLAPSDINSSVGEGYHPNVKGGSATPSSKQGFEALRATGGGSTPQLSPLGTRITGKSGPQVMTPDTKNLMKSRKK
jgi:hypothetical protein